MKVAIAGGGTGGHVYPGIAVAEEVLRRKGEVFFVGTRTGMEAKILANTPYELITLTAAPFKRGRLIQNAGAVIKNAQGVNEAAAILRSRRPDVVLGLGGYVSFAASFAARLIGTPLAIHEQNAIPGLANRLLERVASVVMTAWESDHHVVGLPVRADFSRISRSDARRSLGIPENAKVLLFFGGSRGAASINRAAEAVIPRLEGITSIWATGADHFRPDLKIENARILPYIEKMPEMLAAADLAVTRAGAMTVAELSATGVPAVLVPYPYATADHQTANARAFVDRGAAEMIQDAELSSRLYDVVVSLFSNQNRLEEMRRGMKALSKPDAASKIVDILENVAGRRRARGEAS